MNELPIRLMDGIRRGADAGRKASIMVVDDHPLARKGVAVFLNQEPDLKVICEAADGLSALQMLDRAQPDVVICDLSLPEMSGATVIARIHERFPELPILAYSIHEEQFRAEPVLRAGARGYLMKNAPPEELARAIRTLLSGQLYASKSISQRLNPSGGGEPKFSIDELTPREREVMRMLAQGLATRKIAAALNVSVKTIDSHRERLKQKLQCENGMELVRCALQWYAETDALVD